MASAPTVGYMGKKPIPTKHPTQRISNSCCYRKRKSLDARKKPH